MQSKLKKKKRKERKGEKDRLYFVLTSVELIKNCLKIYLCALLIEGEIAIYWKAIMDEHVLSACYIFHSI